MINRFIEYLKNNNIYNKRIFVAISGGPDSVALLHLLNRFSLEFKLVLEAAYVNHGIRPIEENKKDLILIEKLCSEFKIKLNIKNIRYGEIVEKATSLGSSVEAVARDYRYNFFNELIDTNDLIATGHNCDDQKETQIMRIFQGSSVEGLLGIKDRINNIIRPLIDINKRDILLYLNKNSIKYNIDYTNNELDYLRNRVRNTLIPEIEKIFPSYKNALKNFELELSEYKSIVDGFIKPITWCEENGNFYTNYKNFINLPVLKRRDEIYKIFDQTYKHNIKGLRLPKRFLLPLNKDSFNNGEIILNGHGFILKRTKEMLLWKEINNSTNFFKILIDKKGSYSNSIFTFNIDLEKEGLLISGLSLPFSIRSYVKGYPEVKILKKIDITLNNYNELFIVEKENRVYAIIYMNKIIYLKSRQEHGIFINIF